MKIQCTTSRLTASVRKMAIVAKRFKTIYEIGTGTFGRVEKCFDRETGQVVALKSVPLDNADQFTREVNLMKSLSHPNIVAFYESFEAATELSISMEFCANGNLTNHKSKIDTEMILAIVRDIASALEYLHARDVIHLDVKPQNILVTSIGEVKLGDFGISRHTDTAAAGGTILYMAPELLTGGTPTPAADIWSLGMTAFELATGVPVSLTGFSSFGAWKQVNKLDERVVSVLERMLCVCPKERATAAEIVKMLVDVPATWVIAMRTPNQWITPKAHIFWEDEMAKT